jgi:hypothetical protein
LATDAHDALGEPAARRAYDAAARERDALRRAQEAGRSWAGPSPPSARGASAYPGGYAPRGYSGYGGYGGAYRHADEDSDEEDDPWGPFYAQQSRAGGHRHR